MHGMHCRLGQYSDVDSFPLSWSRSHFLLQVLWRACTLTWSAACARSRKLQGSGGSIPDGAPTWRRRFPAMGKRLLPFSMVINFNLLYSRLLELSPCRFRLLETRRSVLYIFTHEPRWMKTDVTKSCIWLEGTQGGPSFTVQQRPYTARFTRLYPFIYCQE